VPRNSVRVAIIGVGPKGLFALERLLHHAHMADSDTPLDIDLFEPHPTPGAGPIYDPHQPNYLRMNLAADHLNMWWPTSRAVPADEQMSFDEWRQASGDVFSRESFPPRALVGRYLADGLGRLQRCAPSGVRLRLRPVAVWAAQKGISGWRILAADGSSDDYEEVLVAVGHRTHTDARLRDWRHAAPLVPAVFPVTRMLSRDRVAPGATVAVRGFALTFLDAALALTEGRGGSFAAGDHPYRLQYSPSVDDVGVVLPFSRTGRPMLAKPEPALAASVAGLDALTQSGCEQILALTDPFTLNHGMREIIASTAGRGLLAARGIRGGKQARRAESATKHWLTAACAGAPPPAGISAAAEMERSLEVGAGLRPPELQWALGQTWRGLYPALVTRLTGAELPDRSWREFRRLATQMERLAFGPPPINTAKLCALLAAQRVDLTHVAAGEIVTSHQTTSIRSDAGQRAVDTVVDAVLPSPGARDAGSGLLAQLIADGHARLLFERRGLEVADDCSCVGAAGTPTPGMAAIGRPTEDSVIGNDTLNRALHPQVDRWAQRVAQRANPLAAPGRVQQPRQMA
jgi:uncharacterized NAD(P)/FAD-binding protein YdhS